MIAIRRKFEPPRLHQRDFKSAVIKHFNALCYEVPLDQKIVRWTEGKKTRATVNGGCHVIFGPPQYLDPQSKYHRNTWTPFEIDGPLH